MRHAAFQSIPVLALLAAFSQPVMAAPVGEARIELTHLRYQLTDLDPNDGIAPSLVFTGPSYPGQIPTVMFVGGTLANSNETLVDTVQRLDLTGLPFSPQNTGSLSVAGVDAIASKTVDGQLAHSAIETQHVNNLLALYPNGPLTSYTQIATTGINLAAFTLSANTKIEFFGDLSIAAAVDAAAVQPLTNGLFSGTGNLRATAYASINGSIRFSDFSNSDTLNNFAATRQQSYNFNSAGVQLNSEIAQGGEQLYLTLTNPGSVAKAGTLNIYVMANQGLTLTGPVPEPGTLALQTLGLLGLAGIVSRRRR